MTKITVLLCFILSGLFVQAQDEGRTLFGSVSGQESARIGFSLAPGYAFTQMDQAAASLFTLRGGLTLNDRTTLGGFFNHSMGNIFPQSETVSGVYMDYWSAGGMIEYTLFSQKMVHLTFPLQFGLGEVEMDNEIGWAGLGEAYFMVLEPAALLEVNLSRFVRFNLGAGYRLVGPMNYRNFDQSALTGFNAHLGLRLGWFR